MRHAAQLYCHEGGARASQLSVAIGRQISARARHAATTLPAQGCTIIFMYLKIQSIFPSIIHSKTSN